MASTQAHWILYAQYIVNSLYCLMNGVSNWDISQCSVVNSTQTVKYNGFLKIVLKNISPCVFQMGIQTTVSKTQKILFKKIKTRTWYIKISKNEKKALLWQVTSLKDWPQKNYLLIKRLKEVKKQLTHMILYGPYESPYKGFKSLSKVKVIILIEVDYFLQCWKVLARKCLVSSEDYFEIGFRFRK